MGKQRKAFAKLLDSTIRERGFSKNSLAVSAGFDRSYMTKIIQGEKTPSPEFVDLVAQCMNLTVDQTARFHYVAAVDRGYKLPKLDLTTPPPKRKK